MGCGDSRRSAKVQGGSPYVVLRVCGCFRLGINRARHGNPGKREIRRLTSLGTMGNYGAQCASTFVSYDYIIASVIYHGVLPWKQVAV